RLLLTVGDYPVATVGADLLQLVLHGAGVLLSRDLVPLQPVKLGLELSVLLSQPGVSAHPATTAATLEAGTKLAVLLDEARQLALDLVQEGVDLLLVVPSLANRGLLEGDIVNVSRG